MNWVIYHIKSGKYWRKHSLGGGLTTLKSRAQVYTTKQKDKVLVQFAGHVYAHEL